MAFNEGNTVATHTLVGFTNTHTRTHARTHTFLAVIGDPDNSVTLSFLGNYT